MSALTATEQALFNVAKASLPLYLFGDEEEDVTPELIAFAKQFAPVFEDLDLLTQDTYIAVARTEALNQHAKDRGTRRQENEPNETLALRLRFLREDAVTVAAILARTTAVLDSFGIAIPAGYPGIAELRRDRMRYGRTADVQITAIQRSLIADGETFTVQGMTYEFDKTGDGVAPDNVLVDISAVSFGASAVAAKIFDAMTARFGDRLTWPLSGGSLLIRDAPGEVSDTVVNIAFKAFHKKACYSRGYRFTGPASEGSVIVVMLPYGTSAEAAIAVAEALRQIKSGGVKVIVERRLSP